MGTAVQAQVPSGWSRQSVTVWYYYTDGTNHIQTQSLVVPSGACYVSINYNTNWVVIDDAAAVLIWQGSLSTFNSYQS